MNKNHNKKYLPRAYPQNNKFQKGWQHIYACIRIRYQFQP